MGKTIGIGVAGLGRAFRLTADALGRDARVRLVAGADPDADARSRFERDFGAQAVTSLEALCRVRGVDVVYVATPHPLHSRHAIVAAQHGKHVLVEKPMALSAGECRSMVDAARAAGVVLMVGPSHSYDLPIARTKALMGRYGPVRMITALNFTDFAVRRRRDALDTVVHNQAAHQVDIVRLLAGSRVVATQASATETAYTCTLRFESGALATLVYDGGGFFRSDQWMGSGELGEAGVAHPHFGVLIVSCEKADLRPLPTGVMVHEGGEARLEALPPPGILRKEVIDELYAAVAEGKPPLHSGEWGAATMDVVFAMLR